MNQTIWLNGTILTMNDTQQYAEALIAENGKITFVGAAAEAQQKITADSSVIDLNGNTMLPGFYDAHSHFAQTGTLLSTTIDLSPFPFGEMTNWQSCLTRLKTACRNITDRGMADCPWF